MYKILLALIIVSISSISCIKETPPSTTSIWLPESPYSSDPLDFDNLFHHIIFYSVFSPLVSEYKTGAVTGLIAESWSTTADFTSWSFKIRPDMKFSNGDHITPDLVLKSLKRIIFILKNRKSQNSIVENILGIEKFINLNSELPGLKINNNNPSNVVFTFTKPIKNFLSLISFGMYSIVHPSLYDSLTGTWVNKKDTISSAAYVISAWDENHMKLQLRSDYNSTFKVHNDKKLKDITIHWPITNEAIISRNKKNYQTPSSFDLSYGTSDENKNIKNKNMPERDFFGGTISEIRFVRCLSWYLPTSPCSNLEQRILMRDTFYQNLTKLGFTPVKSFFPLVMSGIKDIEYKFQDFENLNSNSDSSKFIKAFTIKKDLTLNVNATNASNPIAKEGYATSLTAMATTLGFALNFKEISSGKIYEDIDLHPKQPEVDICSNVSGIYIDKPQDDVQFMFKSKEGVMLPDTDGRIMNELAHQPVNLQKVNELLWEQAVVWPLSHYGIGFWATKDKYDFSAINLSKTPTMFELIRYK